MRVIENVAIYKCVYCGKELKRKSAMTRHEERCNNNPKNHKHCLSGCVYLQKTNVDVYFDSYILGEEGKRFNVECFQCTKLDKLMFPYSIEKRGLHKRFSTFEGQEPMPTQCESFI